MEIDSPTNVTKPSEANEVGLPSDAEKVALGQSGPLIRFAAENVTDLDKALVVAIAKARQAQIEKTWSPTTSEEFWSAFNALCSLIKPVTVDGLSAEHRNIPLRFRIRFWRAPINESLGERSSRRYTVGLLALLGIIVGFQLITWIYTNLSDDLDKKAKTLQVSSVDLRAKCDLLAPKMLGKDGKQHEWTDGETASYNNIIHDIDALNLESTRLYASGEFLTEILPRFKNSSGSLQSGDLSDWINRCDTAQQNVIITSTLASLASDRARLFSGILLQFLLPVFLGSIGALAYVLRFTSEQIKSTTFTTTSPVRNLVRIALGALMGVVIGLFTDLSTKANLQPLALAFLAGYGVEPVFSLFDGLIARLK
ncbi:hypothetical protein [Solimicrobium silvestre]|uniref:Uncharacterized protein n=1 Tax=Solimicrobium silvestre TaxID=2099400 RepID=A0A2S9GT55_9BURK|nr:hypothetical protein [Solimicrobium silvestre]PRC90881.1 hypothetical protein S2091_4374 [Solimicrobium silvestre]